MPAEKFRNKATASDATNLPGLGGLFLPINSNLYHYAGNNPVRYSDPTGKYSWNQFKNDITPAINLDFGADYARSAADSWSKGNYLQAAVYELDAACEMVYDGLLAYGGAKAVGAIAEGISTLFSIGSVVKGSEAIKKFGPMNKGPLPDTLSKTFRGGSYRQVTLESDLSLYRVYGGNANKLGSFWTKIKPSGPMQSQIDLALKSEWGNTAENVVKINVPAGTTIFEGFAECQGGNLVGGGSQVIIPNVLPSWVVPNE